MDFIILTIGLAMLVGGAESVVRGSVSLGKKLKISLFAIGVVVVAAGTSLPELASCVRSVASNHPDIANQMRLKPRPSIKGNNRDNN